MTKYIGLYYCSNLVTVLPISRLHVPVWLQCLWWEEYTPDPTDIRSDHVTCFGRVDRDVCQFWATALIGRCMISFSPSPQQQQVPDRGNSFRLEPRLKWHNTEPQVISADMEQQRNKPGLSRATELLRLLLLHHLAQAGWHTKWLFQSKPRLLIYPMLSTHNLFYILQPD